MPPGPKKTTAKKSAAPKNAPSSPPSSRRRPAPKRALDPSAMPSSRAARLAAVYKKRRPLVWGLAALAGTLAVATIALLIGFGGLRPQAGAPVEVDWPAGLDSAGAAEKLAELGLVDSRDTMVIFLKATGGTADFVPGPHLLFHGATPWELRRMLARSVLRASAKVTIPEGFNRFDIAARLEKLHIAGRKAFLAASADPALLAELGIVPRDPAAHAESAEGYLFPATYGFSIDTDAHEVVKRLVEEANKRWDAIAASHATGVESLKTSLGYSRFEVLTFASIIEKEAAADDERPIIASVFYNRLRDDNFKPPKRLQSDPTGMYGCIAFPEEAPSCQGFNGKPSPAVNRDAKNRYNTYTAPGLPPGPIANPGVKSIEAALSPANTHYYYFVAQGNGHHTFSETFEAHNDAIQRPH